MPYSQYWHRTIAGMLLSGRVKPKIDGAPNLVDANRLCKEANFNVRLFEDVARLLVAAGIVGVAPMQGRYEPGEFAGAFWNRDVTGLRRAGRRAFLTFVLHPTGYLHWRPAFATESKLDDFLALVARAFDGLALSYKSVGEVFLQFSQLPPDDLVRLGTDLGLKFSRQDVTRWRQWLDPKGQEALRRALFLCEWNYANDARHPTRFFFSATGRIVLGLDDPSPPADLATDFRALPNFSVLAGADLPPEKLVPLFRYCKVQRIDRVIEFRLDKKHLADMTSKSSSASELRAAVAELEPLPSTIDHLLKGSPKTVTGEVRIRGCSAIVKPENVEVLDAIRAHRLLKGYLEAGAPEGYLLIKSSSDPQNFVRRCRELGFVVKTL